MKRMLRYVFALLACLAMPAIAADGYVTGNVNLRAGPDSQYPVVTVVPLGTAVSIQGCTEGWVWCDVVTLGTRGWVSGSYVQYAYQDQRVIVRDNGARIGIPVISFVIGTYWGSYYSDRPFYRHRDYWYHRPIHRPIHRPPPRPIVRPPPPRPRPPGWSGGHRPGPGPGTRPPKPGPGTRPPGPGNGPGNGIRPPGPGNGPRPKPQPRPAPAAQGTGN